MNQLDHRKQEILERVQDEARAAAGRRQTLRAAGAVACTGAALIAIIAALSPSPATPRTAPSIAERPAESSLPPTTGPIPAKLDARITSRRADLGDYAMSDPELLSALEDSGQALGIIWDPEAPEVVSFASRDAESNGG